MSSDPYLQARKNVKKKKGFYKHLAAYIIINTFILISSGGDGPWLPWGIGLAFHYISVFGFPGSGILSKDWEDEEMEKELRKNGAPYKELESGGEPLPDLKKEKSKEKNLEEIPRNWSDKDLV
ncbi:MAG: 2TM domain-containing protein [Saprospiraceae bacterium]